MIVVLYIITAILGLSLLLLLPMMIYEEKNRRKIRIAFRNILIALIICSVFLVACK